MEGYNRSIYGSTNEGGYQNQTPQQKTKKAAIAAAVWEQYPCTSVLKYGIEPWDNSISFEW